MTELARALARLDERVRGLEDERAIREVLSRYAFNADLGREAAWVGLWSDDGVYDFDTRSYRGRAELHTVVADPAGAHKLDIENRSQHLAIDLLVGIEGDTAWCECYSVVLVGTPDSGYRVYTAGHNHFDLVRDGPDWRITRRTRRAVGGAQWGGTVIRSYLGCTPDPAT